MYFVYLIDLKLIKFAIYLNHHLAADWPTNLSKTKLCMPKDYGSVISQYWSVCHTKKCPSWREFLDYQCYDLFWKLHQKKQISVER